MALSKIPFGGSTNFRQVKVAATASAGTLIHTAGTQPDEIWAWASNPDTTTDYELTLQWGGTTSPDDEMKFVVPAKSRIPIIQGDCLQATLVLRAYANVANKVMIGGFVNRLG